MVGCFLAVDYWLFAVHGLGGGNQQVLRDPVDLLLVLGLTVVSAAFHECGHATGCRYGGARPGAVGVGIYLIWPSFFTNVTDSYRLSRGRAAADRPRRPVLQPDLHAGPGRHLRGHLGRRSCSSSSPITHLEMLEQLLPFVRFDGYFILSDLAGVPDLFARVVPIAAQHRVPRGRGTRGSPACAAPPGSW